MEVDARHRVHGVSPVALEEIPESACERHLAQEKVGRVAVTVDDHPEIFPVNYAFVDGRVVFRTDPGAKLDAVADDTSVCFEIDGIDEEHRVGWSVLVVGVAVRVADPDEQARLGELGLEPWTGGRDIWVRIQPRKITGRRLKRTTR